MRNTSCVAALAAAVTICTLTACGGSSSSSMDTTSPPPPPSPPGGTSTLAPFTNVALVGNTPAGTVDTLPAANVAAGDSATYSFPQTMNTNPNLSHGWGVAFGPGSASWVNANATNLSLLFDGSGLPIPTTVQPPVMIPNNGLGLVAQPTGIVANVDTSNCTDPTNLSTCTAGTGFAAGANGPALFLMASLGGTISAWASGDTATVAFDGSADGDILTGVTVYTQPSGQTFLLTTDFAHGTVMVLDSNFQPNTTAFPGGFKDPSLPSNYFPWNVMTIDNRIYVAYAEAPSTPMPAPEDPGEIDGAGLGAVDVFDGTGTLVMQLVGPGGVANAPWGMAIAPQGFGGGYDGMLLVGDFGDGRINAFDLGTGMTSGPLMDAATNAPIRIAGLWGLAFGNGQLGNSVGTLYYAASPDGMTQGLYGSLTPSGGTAPTVPPPAPSPYGP